MRLLKLFVNSAAIFCLLSGLLLTIPPYLKGAKLLSVQTESMQPNINRGDAIWVEPAPVYVYKTGDVISYRDSDNPEVIVSHRLIKIDRDKGIFITKGDNESLNDQPVYPSQVLGKVNYVVPRAGYDLDFIHKPLGMFLIIYFPALLILLSEGKRLRQRLNHHTYRLYGYRRSNDPISNLIW